MPLRTVAIVGRPNVGKSTLFNRLVGKRLALVDDRPGVTRDRREGEASLLGLEFRVIDTAGFEDEDPASLPGRMRQQTEAAVRDADVALFMMDAREGLTPLDEEIGRWLRAEIHARGRGRQQGRRDGRGERGDSKRTVSGSATRSRSAPSTGKVSPTCFRRSRRWSSATSTKPMRRTRARARSSSSPSSAGPTPASRPWSIACSAQERMITGPEAGITRDSISLDWEWEGKAVRLVDTAGLRKRAKVDDKLERLSAADTRRAIDYAEVVVLLLDATRGLEAQDLRIASQVIEEGRALVIALNKWDVAENASALFNGVKAALDEGLAQLRDVPVLTVSAKTGKGADIILKVAFELREAWSRRVPTGELNRWFETAVEANPPPAPKGQRIKLRYITQVKSRPPTFVVFGNRTDELPESYRRYLLNAMRRDLHLGPVPIRLDFRGRSNPFDRDRRQGR